MTTVADSWQATFTNLFHRAVARYREGTREPAGVLTAADLSTLAGMGHSGREVYDFVEDHVRYGEPDLATVLAVAAVRRDYFLEVQEGRPSGRVVDSSTLPPKDAELAGVHWLPRLIAKAQAKLRGEMNEDLMFGCRGDADFFARHKLQPAEFLRYVWSVEGDPDLMTAWVKGKNQA